MVPNKSTQVESRKAKKGRRNRDHGRSADWTSYPQPKVEIPARSCGLPLISASSNDLRRDGRSLTMTSQIEKEKRYRKEEGNKEGGERERERRRECE